MSVLHFSNATKIGILHVLIRFVFTSIMTLAGVLTFYPTRHIFLPGLTAHVHINISSFFSC